MPDYWQLSRAERRDLYRAARRCPGLVAERIHYVRLAAQGRSDAEIASIFEVDARTVREWLERYREGGLEALLDRPDRGGLAK
jgi:transposase